MEKITKPQIKKIQTIRRSLGIDDDVYYRMLAERFGVTSCTKLSVRQARNFIDALQGKTCFACAPRPKRDKLSANVTVLASPDQLHIIEDLRQAHSWAWHPHKYKKWLANKFGAKWAASKWPTDKVVLSIQATQVIEGLKAMIKQEKRCACRMAKGREHGA
jgi:hypothetical protein